MIVMQWNLEMPGLIHDNQSRGTGVTAGWNDQG